eukprot:SAG31_NODE_3378_length_4344_cov_7.620259_2_plen_99_part_00
MVAISPALRMQDPTLYPSRPQVVSSEIMQWLSGSSKWDETIQHDEVITNYFVPNLAWVRIEVISNNFIVLNRRSPTAVASGPRPAVGTKFSTSIFRMK